VHKMCYMYRWLSAPQSTGFSFPHETQIFTPPLYCAKYLKSRTSVCSLGIKSVMQHWIPAKRLKYSRSFDCSLLPMERRHRGPHPMPSEIGLGTYLLADTHPPPPGSRLDSSWGPCWSDTCTIHGLIPSHLGSEGTTFCDHCVRHLFGDFWWSHVLQ
jgi:hypothetical protein